MGTTALPDCQHRKTGVSRETPKTIDTPHRNFTTAFAPPRQSSLEKDPEATRAVALYGSDNQMGHRELRTSSTQASHWGPRPVRGRFDTDPVFATHDVDGQALVNHTDRIRLPTPHTSGHSTSSVLRPITRLAANVRPTIHTQLCLRQWPSPGTSPISGTWTYPCHGPRREDRMRLLAHGLVPGRSPDPATWPCHREVSVFGPCPRGRQIADSPANHQLSPHDHIRCRRHVVMRLYPGPPAPAT